MAERIPVVTSFVYSGDRIALIKRSQKVGTYRGAWAAFSGYVEQIPLDQAYTELSEEAGLSREDVALQGIGIPLPVDDPATGHSWFVLPFLFELRYGGEIRTDWESERWDWFHPDDIDTLETVPGLADALDRVWPAFGDDEFWADLGSVATDKVNGATELARLGLAALGGYVQDRTESIDHDLLVRSIRAFAASRPTMGVFPDLAARLLLAVRKDPGLDSFDVLVTEMTDMIDDTTELSVDNAVQALGAKNRILTLSCSEAVRNTIIRWRHPDSEVFVAESLPGGEGVRLAEQLGANGVQVRVIHDVEIPAVAGIVDAILVGCDAIAEGDQLVNKVGTASAVVSAKDAGIARYAIAQNFKIVPPGWPFFLEQWAGAGVSGHSQYVRMGTVVFDATPLTDFSAVITEEGVLSPERLTDIRGELGSVDLVFC